MNSVSYGLPRKVGTVQQAVAFLGANTIKNTVISASILQAFDRNDGNATLNLKLLWWHSLKCAVTARRLAREMRYQDPEEAFLAGLLHDIGKLALWVNLKEKYAPLLREYLHRPDLLLAGEIRLGFNHCEVEAWLLQHWNLKSFVSDAVLYHHEPIERIMEAFSLVKIIFAANPLSQGPKNSSDCEFETVEKVLGLSRELLKSVQNQADQEVVEVAESFAIEIEPPGAAHGGLSEKDRKMEGALISEVRNVSLMLGTLQNLLEAKDDEEILKSLEHGFRVLFDASNVFFFLMDPERKGLVGKPVDEGGKSSLIDGLLIPMEAKQSLLISCLHQYVPLDSMNISSDSSLALIDDQLIHFLDKEGILCLPLRAHGEPIGVILLGVDETELNDFGKHGKLLDIFTREAAVALHSNILRRRQMQKVQSEGAIASSDMARRVAHEVNNPLSIIKNYLRILGMKFSRENCVGEEIRIINEEIDRIALILSTLTAVSRTGKPKLERVDVNTLIADLVKTIRDSMGEDGGVTIHTELDPSLPKLISEKEGLKQVFINLLKNALEAMPGGGNISISTAKVSIGLEEKLEGRRAGIESYVKIIFQDNGPGIAIVDMSASSPWFSGGWAIPALTAL